MNQKKYFQRPINLQKPTETNKQPLTPPSILTVDNEALTSLVPRKKVISILAIDPSNTTGIVVIRCSLKEGHSPSIITAADFHLKDIHPTSARLLELNHQLTNLIEHHRIDLIIIEDIFYRGLVATFRYLSQMRGAIMLTAAAHRLPIIAINNRRAKKVVAESGDASKLDMQIAIEGLSGVEGLTEAQSDALALFYTFMLVPEHFEKL